MPSHCAQGDQGRNGRRIRARGSLSCSTPLSSTSVDSACMMHEIIITTHVRHFGVSCLCHLGTLGMHTTHRAARQAESLPELPNDCAFRMGRKREEVGVLRMDAARNAESGSHPGIQVLSPFGVNWIRLVSPDSGLMKHKQAQGHKASEIKYRC